MLKKSISVIFFLILTCSTAFAHTAEIEVGDSSGYKAIRLTPEIYNGANQDLSDLLIKDSKGENVPYFIYSGIDKEHTEQTAYPMTLVNSYRKEDAFCFDYQLTEELEHDMIATSIKFETSNNNFVKNTVVYGSYDNINWELVQKDKLYRIDEKAKLEITFSQPEKYPFYRFMLANNTEKIEFEKVELLYSVESKEKSYFAESLTPDFSIEEADKKTVIKIDGLRNLRLCEIQIITDSTFKRMAETQSGLRKELYQLSLNDTLYTDTILPMRGQISQDDSYWVTIRNNDDKPIHITGIVVQYYADEVVFEGEAQEEYILEFGRDSTKQAPVYDIVSYQEEILKGRVDKAAFGMIEIEKETEKPVGQNYRTLFNIVVVLIALLLGGLILRSLQNKHKG